jgi:beta-1,4-mannosyl-glycoprotein beta-1,4-N-acetylglucosaminyltransferase
MSYTPKIYDCFTLRDELDVLELRLNILDGVVDKFVICEANKTFTNQDKPYNYHNNRSRFEKWADKIIYLPIELEDEGLDFETKDTSYNPTSAAWQFEFQQRSALIYGLNQIKPNDLIMLGDIDEIPNPKDVLNIKTPTICVMDFYYYYVNNKSIGPRDNHWLGTAIINKGILDQLSSLQELRNIRHTLQPIKSGWHLSYLGGKEMIKNKIQSFSHTEYNDEKFYGDENISNCLNTGKDIFNRVGMNFSLVNIQDEYPSEILEIILKYPNFIYDPQRHY